MSLPSRLGRNDGHEKQDINAWHAAPTLEGRSARQRRNTRRQKEKTKASATKSSSAELCSTWHCPPLSLFDVLQRDRRDYRFSFSLSLAATNTFAQIQRRFIVRSQALSARVFPSLLSHRPSCCWRRQGTCTPRLLPRPFLFGKRLPLRTAQPSSTCPRQETAIGTVEAQNTPSLLLFGWYLVFAVALHFFPTSPLHFARLPLPSWQVLQRKQRAFPER